LEAAPAREYSSPYHYNKLSTGSFPSRNFGCPNPVEELYNAAAAEQETAAAAAAQHPLGWVPVDKSELGKPSAKCIDDEALAVESRLPLELFDSPEQELIAPEERLAAAGPPGIPSFSRYYTAAGSFTWAPCTVVAYSRWVLARQCDMCCRCMTLVRLLCTVLGLLGGTGAAIMLRWL
jgi:hypothetical protein